MGEVLSIFILYVWYTLVCYVQVQEHKHEHEGQRGMVGVLLQFITLRQYLSLNLEERLVVSPEILLSPTVGLHSYTWLGLELVQVLLPTQTSLHPL